MVVFLIFHSGGTKVAAPTSIIRPLLVAGQANSAHVEDS